MKLVDIEELLLNGESCITCLYYQNRKFEKVCEKMIPIGGHAQPLPKKNICEEWTKKTA